MPSHTCQAFPRPVSEPSFSARPASPTSPLSTQAAPTELMRCPRCGGSGQLRTGHGGYRTCLECAARGILNNDRRAA